MLITIATLLTPIRAQIVKCLSVCGLTPRAASSRTRATLDLDAATAMLRVYCSWPGASAIINLLPFKSDIERYATSIVIPCSRSASSPSVRSEKSISPAAIVEPPRRTLLAVATVS